MCGIFGIINRYKRLLDKRAFITLGCANDSRGGDSCGIMIDGMVDKGTEGEDKYFCNWFNKSKILNNTNKCYIAFGHCRKASVGGVDPNKSQPIIIYNENKEIDFCLIHNGTIYNYEELAKKYIPEIDISNMTDSQVMAYIFYYKGYNVLEEYEGGGAFVIQDYRSNETFIFRGESKASYGAAKPTPERPLYFVKTGKSLIFSSIFYVLQGLYWQFTIYDMPSNILLKCDGNDIYIIKEYDRSEQKGYKSARVHTVSTIYTSSDSLKIEYDCNRGLYVDSSKNHSELHGIVNIGPKGYICKYRSIYTKTYYFWRGIMISGEKAYTALRKFFEEKNTGPKDVMNLARRLSCNPVLINNRFWVYESNNKRIPFTEDYVFPATNSNIYCDDKGKIIAEFDNCDVNEFIPTELSDDSIDKIISYVKTSL